MMGGGYESGTSCTPAHGVVAYTPRAPVVSIQGAGLVITPFSISMGLYKMTVMTPHAECSAVVMIDNVDAAVAWQGYLKDVDFMCPKEGPK